MEIDGKKRDAAQTVCRGGGGVHSFEPRQSRRLIGMLPSVSPSAAE